MHTNAYLFPNRLNRRDFLKLSSTAAAGLALSATAADDAPQGPTRIGSGANTYELDPNWGKLPSGMKYGFGCGIIADSKDRIYVTSRSKTAPVAIFDRDGKVLEVWTQDFADKLGYTLPQVADTAHCLYWSKEGSEEFIYWTENISTNKEGAKFGARVYKTDLKGKILYEIGRGVKSSDTSQPFDWTSPTDVAVAPNGDIYVVDGYGSQRVTRFDKNFKELRTIGGKGKEDAKFSTCHGVWVNTLKNEPEIYIADRHNDRLQVFDLELNHKRTLKGDVRNPCCFYQQGGKLFIPDLASRVTILGPDDKVIAHLGDGKEADGKTNKPDNKTNPALFATPHALTVDSKGSFYLVEWVDFGRARKFKHVPQKA